MLLGHDDDDGTQVFDDDGATASHAGTLPHGAAHATTATASASTTPSTSSSSSSSAPTRNNTVTVFPVSGRVIAPTLLPAPLRNLSAKQRAVSFPLYVRSVQAWTMLNLDRVVAACRDPQLAIDAREALRWDSPEMLSKVADLDYTTRFKDFKRASYTEDEMTRLVEAGSISPLPDDQQPLGVCICFAVIEESRNRSRNIAWTRLLNTILSPDLVKNPRLPQPRDVHQAILKASHCAQLDLKSSFTQVPISTLLKRLTAFKGPTGDQWYAWNRLPMGLCFSVEVMQFNIMCVAHIDADYVDGYSIPKAEYEALSARAAGVQYMVYVDNIFYYGNEDQVAAAVELCKMRCDFIGITLNDSDGVVTKDTFIGIEVDLDEKSVRTGKKSMDRLSEAMKGIDDWTHRELASAMGLLWRDAYVRDARMAKHFFAIRWVAKALTLEPDDPTWSVKVNLPESIRKRIVAWANEAVSRPKYFPRDADEEIDWALITDASADGIGAILVNMKTRVAKMMRESFSADSVQGEYLHSTSGEAWGVAKSLLAFFPAGTSKHIAVVSDASVVVAGLRKFSTASAHVNDALANIQDHFPDARFTPIHISGVCNPADAPSRAIDDPQAEQKLKYAIWLVVNRFNLTRETMARMKSDLGLENPF